MGRLQATRICCICCKVSSISVADEVVTIDVAETDGVDVAFDAIEFAAVLDDRKLGDKGVAQPRAEIETEAAFVDRPLRDGGVPQHVEDVGVEVVVTGFV